MSIRSIAVALLLTLSAQPVFAQEPRYDSGPGYDEAIECRSNNYAFQRCPTPWHDARLVRQLSDTQCVRGVNWGVDRRGVWVDRGCAGRFVAAGRHGRASGRVTREYQKCNPNASGAA